MDASSGRVDRSASAAVIDEISERALEVALSLQDQDRSVEVFAVTMAPDGATKSIRKALAMGAKAAFHIVDPAAAGADALRTAEILSALLRREGFDLIIAGNESTDGRGGVLPAMIAERLGLPAANYLDSVELRGEEIVGTRTVEGGTMRVRTPVPSVISVTERVPEARFPSFKGTLTAKKRPLQLISLAELGVDGRASATEVVSVVERPARAAGVRITDDGSAAGQLADFLASRNLL
nr:electron transfer flavoprotein subunit beta/FixA family protein [Leucobacter weissii]